MDLAAEQGHNSTLKHGVGCTTVAPLRRPLSQARTSATTRPLAARRWPLSAGTVSRSSRVHRSSAAAQRPPMHRRAAQAFQGIGMVQRQALILPRASEPRPGSGQVGLCACAQRVRGIWQPAGAASRPASLRPKWDKPPRSRGSGSKILVATWWLSLKAPLSLCHLPHHIRTRRRDPHAEPAASLIC